MNWKRASNLQRPVTTLKAARKLALSGALRVSSAEVILADQRARAAKRTIAKVER